jgi:hypothetical protein
MKKLLLTGVAALFLATGTSLAISASGIPSYAGIAPYGADPSNGWGKGYGTSGYDVINQAHAEEPACREYLQDGEVAETPEQKEEYAHCMQNLKPKPVRFRPWRQVWQCNDIRIVEFSNREGLIEYDLTGTIWGGSQFARDLMRDRLFFNGRPCVPLR